MLINKNIIPFEMLEFTTFEPKKLTKQIDKPILALDTETLDGFVKLIADSTTSYNYFENLSNKNLDLILQFLTSNRFENSHNFFYNLNYDVNAIIKYLPEKNLNELYQGLEMEKYNWKTKEKEVRLVNNTTKYNDYTLFFIPKKIFKISKNHKTYTYYDIAQFFGNSLEYNAKKYLNKDKYIHILNDGNKIDGQALGTNEIYWKINKDTIIEYCINDCILTKELGDILYNTLKNKINIMPNSFISKASITKEYYKKFIDIPFIKNIPKSAIKYAFDSYCGGRFETIKRGNVGKCTLFDINSAYPFHMKNLIDINQGEWKRTKSLHESAYYGFYKVKLLTKFNKISPISIALPNGINVFPITELITFLTKQELLSFENYIDYEIISGWEYYPKEIIYPFNDFIELVYNHKNNTDKNNFEYSLWKILMNGGYGTFYEKHLDKIRNKIITGKFFNPIYATLITKQTQIQLFDLAIDNLNDLVAFATDSCLFNGNPDINISKDLGKWDIEYNPNSESLVLKSGIYKIGDSMKNRGIKKAEFLKTPYGNYDSIFTYIENQPNLSIYPIKMIRPLTFIEVLLHHKKHTLSAQELSITAKIPIIMIIAIIIQSPIIRQNSNRKH